MGKMLSRESERATNVVTFPPSEPPNHHHHTPWRIRSPFTSSLLHGSGSGNHLSWDKEREEGMDITKVGLEAGGIPPNRADHPPPLLAILRSPPIPFPIDRSSLYSVHALCKHGHGVMHRKSPHDGSLRTLLKGPTTFIIWTTRPPEKGKRMQNLNNFSVYLPPTTNRVGIFFICTTHPTRAPSSFRIHHDPRLSPFFSGAGHQTRILSSPLHFTPPLLSSSSSFLFLSETRQKRGRKEEALHTHTGDRSSSLKPRGSHMEILFREKREREEGKIHQEEERESS